MSDQSNLKGPWKGELTTILLTEPEAAERLRIGERTLRGIRQRGEIKYVLIGARKIFYRPEDCDEYVAAHVRVEQPCPIQRKPKRQKAGNFGNVVAFPDYMA